MKIQKSFQGVIIITYAVIYMPTISAVEILSAPLISSE